MVKMNGKYLNEFMSEFSFPEESRGPLNDAYTALTDNAIAKNVYFGILDEYDTNMNCDFAVIGQKINDIAVTVGISPMTVNLLVLIGLSLIARKYYESFGIPKEIWKNSMYDIKYKLTECKLIYNTWGNFVFQWYAGFFRLYRFGLGRLQFDLIKFGRDYKFGEKALHPSDNVLFVHIPRTGERLKKEEVNESYMLAREFFKKVLRSDFTPFVCSSWLLFPKTLEFLSPESNIYKFASDYDVIETGYNDDYGEVWRLFDKLYEGDAGTLPQDTSLRRKYAEYISEGGKFGYGYGVYILPQDTSLRRKYAE